MVGTGRLPGEVGVPWRPHVVKCVPTGPETSLSVVLETAVGVCVSIQAHKQADLIRV